MGRCLWGRTESDTTEVTAAAATLHCGVWASHYSDFSCCGAQALGAWTSVFEARGVSSCGFQALDCRLNSCGAWT